ncbi:MAG: formylglycine-generating enzyme family protein [candidate division KSB1 bacterium]|nr:formylglycine-generating enzyme family protein [candidate division KSB1 bacterium]MDZ7367830.1 formylglycine-generating enzyme family protein [candidate division KSB1 bacterium]MDZ7405506.1 formylglycine-generating enzyme family protein [candidate division KSB1 bacterium]
MSRQRMKATNGFFLFHLFVIIFPCAAQDLSPFVETIPGTSVKFEMIPLAAGAITINNTTVEIKPLWIGKTEVTWDEYDIYAFKLDEKENQKIGELDAIARPTKPYGAPDRGFGHQGYPALSMTFHTAQEYCRWLSAKTGKKYRLPTEAEWEYACRAGETEKISPASLDQRAWFWDNAEDKTHPVATKQPNKWGLCDMLGNAAEWVVGLDGKPVVAGGSYKDKAAKLHSGAREANADVAHDRSANAEEQMVAVGCDVCGISDRVRAVKNRPTKYANDAKPNKAKIWQNDLFCP